MEGGSAASISERMRSPHWWIESSRAGAGLVGARCVAALEGAKVAVSEAMVPYFRFHLPRSTCAKRRFFSTGDFLKGEQIGPERGPPQPQQAPASERASTYPLPSLA